MISILKRLIDLIYPPLCSVCGRLIVEENSDSLCLNCLNQIRYIKEPFCSRCGKPLLGDLTQICHDCFRTRFHFEQARAVALYGGILRDVIHRFKYAQKKALAKPLGNLLVKFMEENPYLQRVDLLVSVPLCRQRSREREFNQADLLARIVGEHFKLPLVSHSLCRIKTTISQSRLSREERLKNIEGAFEVKRKGIFSGKVILLIDDIFTTGATANECARVLVEAGAKKVLVLTLARGV